MCACVTAVLNPVFFGEYSALSREISSAFRERGVKIRPVNKTMDEWLEAVKSGSVDLVVGRWAADYPDEQTYLMLFYGKYAPVGGINSCAYVNPRYDELYEKASVMEPGPVTVRANEPLEPLLQRMASRGVTENVVTTPDGRLLGVVCR